MDFNDLVLIAESNNDDGEQFVEAVLKWLADNADFNETDHPHFKTVGNIVFNLCQEDLIDMKEEYEEDNPDGNEDTEVSYGQVIDHFSNLLDADSDFDPYNNTALANWAFGDGSIAEKAWRNRIEIRNALKSNEHGGTDLTF